MSRVAIPKPASFAPRSNGRSSALKSSGYEADGLTHSTTAKLLDGTPVDCEFEVIEHGYDGNGWDDPGEGSVIGVESAEMEDGTLVLLTDEERDALELQIAEQVDSDPHFFAFDD